MNGQTFSHNPRKGGNSHHHWSYHGGSSLVFLGKIVYATVFNSSAIWAATFHLPGLTWCVLYFRVSKQWYGCQCLRVLTCTQVSRHAVEHRYSLPWKSTRRKILGHSCSWTGIICTPDLIICTPDLIICTPDLIICTPNLIICTPDLIICTPNLIICTPDPIIRSFLHSCYTVIFKTRSLVD